MSTCLPVRYLPTPSGNGFRDSTRTDAGRRSGYWHQRLYKLEMERRYVPAAYTSLCVCACIAVSYRQTLDGRLRCCYYFTALR